MQELWDLIVNNFIGYLMVFFRVTGIFTFNPIFGRQNIPVRVRVAMSMALAMSMLSFLGGETGYVPVSLVGMIAVLMKELLVGFLLGFMTNLVMTVFVYAGELMDNQMGLSMAKAMDPSTGVQMPVMGNVLNYVFILFFFTVGGHLEYIKLFSMSYELLPIGFQLNEMSLDLTKIIVDYFGTVMVLGCKLAMPLVATELIVEFCIGIIMKAVPTIQVMTINIQLKVLVGLFVLMSITGVIADFIEKFYAILMDDLFMVIDKFA